MRRFPSGVAVVTSLREGELRGMTLTAFAGVSADPPSVLICVNRSARSYLNIAHSRIFCVNLLAHAQELLATHFSGSVREHQFESIAHDVAVTGAPVLRDALAFLDCEVANEHHEGSHSIFVGRVLACGAQAGAPLGYFDGAFHDFDLSVG